MVTGLELAPLPYPRYNSAMQLDTLFNPRSVAVIGATNDPHKVGYALMKNILAGAPRAVYPISLAEAEVLGQVTHASVLLVPDTIDLAVIAVRASAVPAVLTECGRKGITQAIVISAGFKEEGEAGAALEAEVAAIATAQGMTLLGPNCLGVIDTHHAWNATFAVGAPQQGSIAFVSQSGALGTALLDWATREGVGFSKFISLGNEAAQDELAFLEYLITDEATNAVLLYLEHVADGARFRDVVTRLTARKPLAVLRAGRSSRGARAVASHTGSLAPSDAVFATALRQAGAIAVDSTRDFFSLAKLFSLGITAPHPRLAVLTNGGGPSVNTADLIDLSPTLSLATFSDTTKDLLRTALPPMAAVGNPIDVIGDAGPDRYDGCLSVLATLPDVDAILTLVTPQMMTDPAGIAEVLLRHRAQKPLVPILMGGAAVEPGRAALRAQGMTSFDVPSDAVAALGAMGMDERKEERGKRKEMDEREEGGGRGKETHDTLTMMPFTEMRELLATYHLPLTGEFVRAHSELEQACTRLGSGPYAIKAISAELVHKSDLHAVELHCTDATSLAAAWDRITAYVHEHAPGVALDGMLVQRMEHGVECIIGMKRDATFGPVILFGLGGVFVEILGDTALRVAPVSKEEALAQIGEIKGLPLLSGARGGEPANLDALADLIASLATLALEHPEVVEVDCNPVFATRNGVAVVDVRVLR